MDELINILASDVPNWALLLEKYRPLKISIATSMDNKQRPIFLPERAVELSIGELLANYFTSTPSKVILCLACLEEGSELIEETYRDDKSSMVSRLKTGKGTIGKEKPRKDKMKKEKKEKGKAKEKDDKDIVKSEVKSESEDFITIKVRIRHNYYYNINYIYSKNQRRLFEINVLTQKCLLIIHLLIVSFVFQSLPSL